MSRLTHIDETGAAVMVDVGDKAVTHRTAVAEGHVAMKPETLALIRSGGAKKGDVLGVARIAGIMAAKKTHELIPLCHPLLLTKVALDLELDDHLPGVRITATVRVGGQTGVEMEALTAVSVACLTIYDMAKAADREMTIGGVRLMEKSGGKSGDYRRSDDRRAQTALTNERPAAGRGRAGADHRIRRDADRRRNDRHGGCLRPRAGRPSRRKRTQPPFTASAMDGYAVRAGDVAPGQALTLVGESAAGRRYPGRVRPGEAVRIFTGAPVPEGADSILIQENADETDGSVMPRETLAPNRHIRPAGLDFAAGQRFFTAGQRLGAKDMALAAALGAGEVSVRRRPRVAVLATGDELVAPGAATGPDQIIASNHLAVTALATKAGAEPRFFGIAADDLATLDRSIAAAREWDADILVTLGGASVGDRDLVKAALSAAGLELGFWRIAMRPGKPLMFGRLDAMRVLGLPGNPASAVVCAHLFLKPLIAAFLGEPRRDPTRTGRLGKPLPDNDQRQDYLRATLALGDDGLPVLTPLPAQDSSLTSILATADALVVRPPMRRPRRPESPAGSSCWTDRRKRHACRTQREHVKMFMVCAAPESQPARGSDRPC